MKRNLDLIRNILLRMEEMSVFGDFDDNFPEFTHEEVHYHLYLLQDVNFIEAYDDSEIGRMGFRPTKITWAGQEFLDNARNDTVWNKTKNKVKEAATSVSIAVFSQLLAQMAAGQFGLK